MMRSLGIGAVLCLVWTAGCAYDTSDAGDEGTGEVESQIVNGSAAAKRAWPSALAITVTFSSGAQEPCAATIIHPKQLLTAAHCVSKPGQTVKAVSVTPNVDNLFDLNAVSVVVGASVRFPPGIDLTATPAPSPDVAVLDLTDALPASFQRNQRTDDLVSPALLPTIQVQNPTTLIGWGAQDVEGSTDGQLMQVNAPFLGVGGACTSLTGWTSVRANEYCAGFTNVYRGVCDGDSGGPDYFRIGGAWKELGVISWTTADCGSSSVNRPSVMALGPSVYDWVSANLPNSEARVTLAQTAEVAGAVSQSELVQAGLSSKWDVIVPGAFSSLSSTSQGLLTYSRSRGEVQIFRINASKSLTRLKTHTGLPTTWTQVIPGQFDGTGSIDFFAYDAVAQTGAFYLCDASGNITLRNTVTDKSKLLKVWRIMVPGKFNSDGLTDLFFYDPTTGAARVYTTDSAGNLNEATVRTFAKNWEIILPGEFNGDATFTDLLLYNPSEGRVKVTGTAMVSGVIHPAASTLVENTTFGKNWQYLVAGSFAGSGLTDIAAYDPLQGPSLLPNGQPDFGHGTLRYFNTVETLNAAGAVAAVALQAASSLPWPKVYNQLVSYTRSASVVRSDILAYERFSKLTKRTKGDMNGDGRADIVVTGGPGWTSVPWGQSNGDGTFTSRNLDIAGGSRFPSWASGAGVKAIAGDYNGDGLNDVALAGGVGWNDIAIAFADGVGNYSVTDEVVGNFGIWAGEANVRIVPGDFDGDGRGDLALIGGANWLDIPIAFSNGNGTFRIVDLDTPTFAKWARDPSVKVVPGDFDGDGKGDIALLGGPAWKDIAIAFSKGDGSFSITDFVVTGSNFGLWAGAAGVKALAGDFDGDGKSDIALSGAAGWNDVPVAFSNGDGKFTVADPILSGFPRWAAEANVRIVSGDFDGDGRSDLALLGGATWNDVPIAYSTGRGTFRQTDLVSSDLATWARRATNKILSEY